MNDEKAKPNAMTVGPNRLLGRAGREVNRGIKPGKEGGQQIAPFSTPTALEAPAPAWPEVAQHAQLLFNMRRRRQRRFFIRFAVFVGLPAFATLLYILTWASPRYVSEFEVTYQTFRPTQNLSSGLVESLVGSSQNNNIDLGSILYEYIRSPALLDKLDAQLHLRAYYSDPKVDYLSRLGTSASRENFLDYYRWRVSVSEGLGGYLTVSVTAFDPQFTFALAKAVVQACDEMVDNMMARPKQDEIRSAEAELARQEDRLRRARSALTQFQNAHGDLDPQHVAGQLQQIAGSLEAQLSAERANLTDALSYMSAASPIVAQLKLKIAALEDQLRNEQDRLASTGSKTPYSQILDQYSALQLEQEFAKNAYLAAQQGLALARADADRQQNYLFDFAPPSKPDRSTLYFPLRYSLTAFLGALLVFGIGSLMAGALRDQAGL